VVKKSIVVLLFSVLCLFANQTLDDTIKSYVGSSRYETQKNLINVLFASSQDFLKSDGRVDSVKVMDVLKKNGLVRLLYPEPVHLRLAFRTQHEPLIFLKIINETLELMGYNYFLTNNALRDQAGFVWEIYLQTEHILDPVAFANALGARGCSITQIVKNSDHYWFYDINSKDAHLGVKSLENGVNTPLGKPLKPYWIRVKGAKEVIITAHISDQWFPDVVFFDEYLNVISDTKAEESARNLKLTVPQSAVYIKIGDTVMLDNIKRGLSLHVKGN
jgi:hypothetical protein